MVQSKLLVAGAEPATAAGAMVVSPLQMQRSENAVESFRAPAGVSGHLPARAFPMRFGPVGPVRIQALFHRPGGQAEHLSPHRRFECFQIQLGQILAAEQCLDVVQDLSREQTVERGFF